MDIIKEYIDSLPDKAKDPVTRVINCIKQAAPNAEAKINYGVLAFALVPNGKRDEQIMVGGYAKHTGFYPHPTTIAYFEKELVQYKHAKGSVQFPHSRPIPDELIVEMVAYRNKILNG